MDDSILTQLLALMEKLQKENSVLKQRIEELSQKKQSPICLSTMREPIVSIDDYVRNIPRRQQELSTSKEAILQSKVRKTVDNILQYADSVGFQ